MTKVMINYEQEVLSVDGEILPIVYWSRGPNANCTLREAWGCVAGPTKDGEWIVQPLGDYTIGYDVEIVSTPLH